jgi:surfeit locus 1 family protein
VPRRAVLALVLGVVIAAVCARLGVWQLDRLAQRRARNADVSARRRAAPVPVSALPSDTAAARYRRVILEGRFDFDNEMVLTGRSRNGAPGVHILTPLRSDGAVQAVLVNRGWVYSPDAVTVTLADHREPSRISLSGYVQTFVASSGEPARASGSRTWRRLDGDAIAATLPYPIAPFYVVAEAVDSVYAAAPKQPGLLAPTREDRARPVRLPPPELGDGPHRGYAVQWFSFAAIALVGTAVLAWQDTRRRPGSSYHRTG